MSRIAATPRRSRRLPVPAGGAPGFSLIELLVAVFVMAVGVLGIVGLQVLSLQNNRNALYRAEAAQLAYDMMDRIRANANIAGGVDYSPIALDAAPAAPTDCRDNNCTPAQMETFDHAFWKCSLGEFNAEDVCTDLGIQGFLPEGDGAIALNGTVYTITVQWREPNAPAAQQIQIESTP